MALAGDGGAAEGGGKGDGRVLSCLEIVTGSGNPMLLPQVCGVGERRVAGGEAAGVREGRTEKEGAGEAARVRGRGQACLSDSGHAPREGAKGSRRPACSSPESGAFRLLTEGRLREQMHRREL